MFGELKWMRKEAVMHDSIEVADATFAWKNKQLEIWPGFEPNTSKLQILQL
jgi:hypothetical protein